MDTAEQVQAFGRELRRRRHALGLTLEALAEATGITPNYIGSIEMGHRDPSLSTVMRIGHGLGIPAGELFGLPELPPLAVEAARHLAALPAEVREPVVGALRALAAWAGRKP